MVDGAPCLWAEHLDRLAAGCRELGIPLDPAALTAGLRRLLEARTVPRGALRIQVTGGSNRAEGED